MLPTCAAISPRVCNLADKNTMQKTAERELLQASGKIGTHQTQADAKPLPPAYN
jgi:hypothetical protein